MRTTVTPLGDRGTFQRGAVELSWEDRVNRSALRLVALIASLVVAGSACSDDDGPSVPQEPALACAADSAVYTLTFRSVWSAATHPEGFPEFAHFSSLIGGTHRDAVSFWNEDSLASPGIQAMAEIGSKTPLRDEVQAAIDAGDAARIISGGGLIVSPGSVDVTFTMDPSFPLVTVVSMIAPSPDWFVGVSGLSLCDDGEWVDSLVVDLYAYDAGTDSGIDYGSLNEPSVPHVPIYSIEQAPFLVEGEIPILGTFTFVRN